MKLNSGPRNLEFPCLQVLLTGLVFVTLSAPMVAQQAAPGCSGGEKARQFDFWIGEWDVTAGGDFAGHNKIEPILNKCVLQENWQGSSGSAGSSFNFYNPQKGKWQQFWVWRNGTTLELEGEYRDGKMVLEGQSVTRQGQTVLNRVTWYDNEDGTVRQHWQVSSDGGKTWSDSFDGLYKKKESR